MKRLQFIPIMHSTWPTGVPCIFRLHTDEIVRGKLAEYADAFWIDDDRGNRQYAPIDHAAECHLIVIQDVEPVKDGAVRSTSKARDFLKLTMESNGFTPGEMARMMLVTPSHMSMILSGDRSLTVEQVRRFCDYFAVSADRVI